MSTKILQRQMVNITRLSIRTVQGNLFHRFAFELKFLAKIQVRIFVNCD